MQITRSTLAAASVHFTHGQTIFPVTWGEHVTGEQYAGGRSA